MLCWAAVALCRGQGQFPRLDVSDEGSTVKVNTRLDIASYHSFV